MTKVFKPKQPALALTRDELAAFLVRETEIVSPEDWSKVCQECGDQGSNEEILERLQQMPATWGKHHAPDQNALTSFQAEGLRAGMGQILRLENFILRSPLNSGGMGQTYLARDKFNRLVVIKMIKRDVIDEQSLSLFKREADLMAQIDHPHVAQIYDSSGDPDAPFIAMQFVPGVDLAAYTRQQFGSNSPPSVAWVVDHMIPVIDAINKIHERQILHRDIKPSNLMLRSDDDRVIVIDFGLARQPDFTLTTERDWRISPLYAPGEQWHSPGKVTGAADIYALGATLFELLTGHPPFRATSHLELMNLHCGAPRPDAHAERSDVSESLANLIQQMMATDPAARPTGQEVVQRLEASSNVKQQWNAAATATWPVATHVRSSRKLGNRKLVAIATSVLIVSAILLLMLGSLEHWPWTASTAVVPNTSEASAETIKATPQRQAKSPLNSSPKQLAKKPSAISGLATISSSRPRLSSQTIRDARHIAGWGAAWSPDGRKIARQDQTSGELEIIDLETGENVSLEMKGSDPAWSQREDSLIAFIDGEHKLAVVRPDGTQLQSFDVGGDIFFPSWTLAGKLYFWQYTTGFLCLLDVNDPAALKDPAAQVEKVLSCQSPWPSVSPDGRLVAYQDQGSNQLLIVNLDTGEVELEYSVPWGWGVLSGWSPDSRQLGWGRFGNSPEGLWMLDLESRQVWKAADGALTAPRWSPNGKQITVDDRRVPQQLLILDATLLTAPSESCVVVSDKPLLTAEDIHKAQRVEGWAAAWSPDGKKLARHRTDTQSLSIIDLDSGEDTKLFAGGGDPAWSTRADGLLAFTRDESKEMWLIRPDGSGSRQLETECFHPTWSASGKLLYYWNYRTGFLCALEIDDLAAKPTNVIECPSPWAAISPAGQFVAYQDSQELAILDIPTREVVIRHAIPSWNGLFASWSPDGRYLGFGSFGFGGEGLWVLDSQARRVWKVADGALTLPRWSPDGLRVAVDVRQGPKSSWELRIFDAAKILSPAVAE